jgi:hypothetical protein
MYTLLVVLTQGEVEDLDQLTLALGKSLLKGEIISFSTRSKDPDIGNRGVSG